MAAVVFAVVAPWVVAGDELNQEEPESLLSNLAGASAGAKPFNLQGASSQRRAHGIYFNGR